MIRVNPGGLPIPPQGPKKSGDKGEAHEAPKVPARPEGGGKVPFAMDAQAMAIADELYKLAKEARGHELSFEEIIEKVMKETGLVDPQAAMEEADRKLQEEIETTLTQIKQNKDLMEEAEAWQSLADLLESNLSSEQVRSFMDMLQSEVRGLQ